MHPKDIGIRIRQVREHLGMTQADFAELAGVSRAATISGWEHGKEIPGIEKLRAIAEAVGEDAAYLFGVFGDEQLRYGGGGEEFTEGLSAKLPVWKGQVADYAEMSKSLDPSVVREDMLRTYTSRGAAVNGGDVHNGTSDLTRQIDEINRGPGTRAEKDRAIETIAAAYRSEAMREEAVGARERGTASRIEAIKAPNRNVQKVASSDLEAVLFQFAEIIQRMQQGGSQSPGASSNATPMTPD